MQISASRARDWENKPWLKWLTDAENFVGIDNFGSALPGVWSSPPMDGQQQAAFRNPL